MYKVLHFSDSHLGRNHPSKISKERVQSSIKAFRYCIEKAVEEDVDFVIHAGDVFDTVYPWHTVIESAKKELEKLEEENIPMYCIRGNHDRSFGQGRSLKGLAIEHLTSDNVKLIDPQAAEFPENGFIDHDENIRIYGLGYHASRTQEILREFNPETEKFNFLLLHDFIDGVTRSYSENTGKADVIAGKDVQYVAIGHDHQPNPEQRIGSTVFSATGGTVDYDFNTTSFGKTYNILEIDTDSEEVELENYEIPQELELVKENFSVDDRIEEILETIKQKMETGKKYAFKLKISGKADSETEIPSQEISERIEEVENVLLAETILDIKVEGMDEYEDGSDKFNIHEYLEKHLQNNSVDKEVVELHEKTEDMLGNEENLTRSGFSLGKESRRDLRRKVEKKLFGGEEN